MSSAQMGIWPLLHHFIVAAKSKRACAPGIGFQVVWVPVIPFLFTAPDPVTPPSPHPRPLACTPFQPSVL